MTKSSDSQKRWQEQYGRSLQDPVTMNASTGGQADPPVIEGVPKVDQNDGTMGDDSAPEERAATAEDKPVRPENPVRFFRTSFRRVRLNETPPERDRLPGRSASCGPACYGTIRL